jgi:hypothetical protein
MDEPHVKAAGAAGISLKLVSTLVDQQNNTMPFIDADATKAATVPGVCKAALSDGGLALDVQVPLDPNLARGVSTALQRLFPKSEIHWSTRSTRESPMPQRNE